MAEPVLIRYTRPGEGKILFRGPSGSKYRFGGSAREGYVRAEDVDFFVQRADFELVEKPPEPKEPTFKKELEAEFVEDALPASEGVSLRDVEGIGPASERKLNEAGIVTIADLTNLAPEALADLLGFSEERIGKIIESAREKL